MALDTGLDPPPPFMANAILNFHFDYLNPSLTSHIRSSPSVSRIYPHHCFIAAEAPNY